MNNFLNGILNKGKSFLRSFFYIEKWKENKSKRPQKKQLTSFLKIISKPEKILFILFLITLPLSGILWARLYYLESTKIVPQEGGVITETMIGQPQSLNPLLGALNDADRDISQLIYAGLLKYDNNGSLKENLAEKYEVSSDGKIYTFTLKKNLFWSDGKKITINDIFFTFENIQNPETQSPLRMVFQDVNLEKIDEKNIRFVLESPYSYFLENFTFGIIPQHIFKNIPPTELSITLPKEFANSGPFKVKKVNKNQEEKIESVFLEKNEKYYQNTYLNGFDLFFVETEEDLIARRKKSTSLAGISAKNKNKVGKSFQLHSLALPRYFALFLNQENKIINSKEIKEAMTLATPKDEIIERVFLNEARKVDSAFLPENNIEGEYKKYDFDIEAAKKILEENNWKDTNNDGVREKVIEEGQDPIALNFTIFTVNQAELSSAARIIEKSWKEAGIKIEVKPLPPQELLQTIIKERKYDILLFGQSLMMVPEPYPFWHSSQIKYPGLNLSLYKNNDLDKLLDEERKETSSEKRMALLQNIQQKIAEDIPAIFLYSPNYVYPVKKNVKNINTKYILDPSKRFTDVENWYIKEKRIPKE